VDGVPVSASILQSIYSRFPNFLNHFIVTSNTLPITGTKTYDISLKYPYKSIPKEGNVSQGIVPRVTDYNDTHFDVTENVTNDTYEILDTAWGKALVNAFTTPRKLEFVGNAVASVVENAGLDKVTMTLTYIDTNDQVAVFSSGTQVGAEPARINLGSTDFISSRDAANDWIDISLKNNYLPNPLFGQYGLYRFAGNEDGHKEGIFSGFDITDNGGGTTDLTDDADGVCATWETGGDDNDYIELSCSPDFMTRRNYNPHLYGKIKIVGDSFRWFAGFHDNDPLAEDDNSPLNGSNGFGFSYTTDGPDGTTYQIRRNNAAATESKTNTALTFATGTLVSFHIWATSAGWFWSVNNGAASAAITAAVPAAATRLSFTARLEEIAGDAQTVQIYYLYYVADK
jgi:hypothetical protein